MATTPKDPNSKCGCRDYVTQQNPPVHRPFRICNDSFLDEVQLNRKVKCTSETYPLNPKPYFHLGLQR